MTVEKYHTFLSYNRTDAPSVEKLAVRLRSEGIEPWFDKWNLIPGEPWQEAIERALLECTACCVFIGPTGIGPWQNAEMRSALDRRISTGALRVIPVLLPGAQRGERSHYPSFLTQTSWVEFRDTLEDPEGFRYLVAGIRNLRPGPADGSSPNLKGCPYRGLQIFDVEHEHLFFGREALTEWLVERLRAQERQAHAVRFLAVIGPSGSGKSSLLRAGLIPALRRGVLPGSEDWPLTILKPGPHPIESLAVALANNPMTGRVAGDVGNLKVRLSKEPDRLHLVTRQALGESDSGRVLVLVDQFEELFTQCEDEDLRRAFIDGLVYAASDAVGKTIVLLTTRADFYGRCADYYDLSRLLSDQQMLVGPMSVDELRDAIVKPARLAGCELEAGLVEMLLDEAGGEAGGLPLLQYGLAQLWKRRTGKKLTVASYDGIGRLQGALNQRAEEVFHAMDSAEKQACKQIFLRLTRPGEGTEDTKRRASREELGRSGTVERVLRILVKERLVTAEGGDENSGAQFEVSHEALIRGWPRLRKWLDQNREDLRLRLRLSQAAREWRDCRAKGEVDSEDYVLRGKRLTEVEGLLERMEDGFSQSEQEFLAVCRAVRAQHSRKRRFVLLGVVVLLLLFGAGLAIGTQLYIEREKTNRELAKSREVIQNEAARSDILGALTVFGTGYGQAALEEAGGGVFTAAFVEHAFDEFTSLSQAAANAQNDMKRGSIQTAEVLSSLNGQIFLNPRNDKRTFVSLVIGLEKYENWPPLRSAVADAVAVHTRLADLGYDSTLLTNSGYDEIRDAIQGLFRSALAGCLRSLPESRTPSGKLRGIVVPVEPCQNTALFVYVAGHGFSHDGISYVVPVDAKHLNSLDTISESEFIGVEPLRARMAEAVAIQIVIADTSRAIFRVG